MCLMNAQADLSRTCNLVRNAVPDSIGITRVIFRENHCIVLSGHTCFSEVSLQVHVGPVHS